MLVFTERKTRYEMIFRADDKTVVSTLSVLDSIERSLGDKFKKIFKSITCDNGSEFYASDVFEKSVFGFDKRTDFYYCHPYSSSERGSNEKNNQMIRRWMPKGQKIESYSDAYINHVTEWLNNYPRGIFNFKSSRDLFEIELQKLGIKNFL